MDQQELNIEIQDAGTHRVELPSHKRELRLLGLGVAWSIVLASLALGIALLR